MADADTAGDVTPALHRDVVADLDITFETDVTPDRTSGADDHPITDEAELADPTQFAETKVVSNLCGESDSCRVVNQVARRWIHR